MDCVGSEGNKNIYTYIIYLYNSLRVLYKYGHVYSYISLNITKIIPHKYSILLCMETN